jgi:hypothetical protein
MMMWPFPDDGFSGSADSRSTASGDADARLARQVAERLAADERTRDRGITVQAQNAVVILTGVVDHEDAKLVAPVTARSTHGVRDVCDALVVRGPAGSTPASPDRGSPDVLYGADQSNHARPHRFAEIVAELLTEDNRATWRPAGGLRRSTRLVLLILAAVAWALLSMLMVWQGWIAVLAVSMVAAMALGVLHRRGRRIVVHGRARCPQRAGPTDTDA